MDGLIALAAAALGLVPASAAAIIAKAAASRLFLRTSHADLQLAVAHLVAIERADGFLGFDLCAHFDKGKALRLTAVTVLDEGHGCHGASLRKQGFQVLFRG